MTFQEYFTAREITSNPSKEVLQELVSHIMEKRWREVFLLSMEMLKDATELVQLMKSAIDGMVKDDEKIQKYLGWVDEKSKSVNASYKLAAIRAFYFDRIINKCPYQWSNYTNIEADLQIDNCLRTCINVLNFSQNNDYKPINNYVSHLARKLDPKLLKDLQLWDNVTPYDYLHEIEEGLGNQQLLILHDYEEHFKNAIELAKKLSTEELANALENLLTINQNTWLTELIYLLKKHRNIDYNYWHFNQKQIELLKQYNNAIGLLIDCWNRECVIERRVRDEIERTLFLPYDKLMC